MNREQMVERIVLAVEDGPTWNQAREILDVILPLVSTVAEIDALPDETALITTDGRLFRAYVAQLAPDHAHLTFPLTVVWKPEVTA